MSLRRETQARQQTVAAIRAAAERVGHRIQYPLTDGISLEPSVPCDFKVGDIVTVINGYGIPIPGKMVTGFRAVITPNFRPESFVFLDWDCYWFDVSPARLILEKRAT